LEQLFPSQSSQPCAQGKVSYIGFMMIPSEVPVMTLPNATLFPQALLPLYIFEPRYRQMLVDMLHSHRMFSVAMQKPGTSRETPMGVAGLGLIRVSVSHKDGTSHLIVQGVTRVQLEKTVRYKPYRIQRIKPLSSETPDSVAADALLARVRELLRERLKHGVPFPFPLVTHPGEGLSNQKLPAISPKEILKYLDAITDPEQAADLVSCAVLSGGADRQAILEALDVETRLRRLAHFLLRDIQAQTKGKN
jgi:ATP-dependent Lon protease